MKKVKTTISGKVCSAKTVEVVDAKRSKLIPGQKVLIYKPTSNNIMSSSGKIIGKKETVLGAGEVKIEGDRVVVVLSTTTGATNLHKTKLNRQKVRKISNVKYSIARRSAKEKNDTTVLIKPIEE